VENRVYWHTRTQKVLDSKHPVLGSIPLRGGAFTEEIKKRKDVLLVWVSEKNRDGLANEFMRVRA